MPASAREISIMRNVYAKVDRLSFSFGIVRYSDELSDEEVEEQFITDIRDTLRELRIANADTIGRMSPLEYWVEQRTMYHALRRFQIAGAAFFKFSTATDGKSVDKSMIPKMLGNIIDSMNTEFLNWRSTAGTDLGNIGTASGLWNRENTVRVDGEYSADA
jgi:hypothetical protein